MLGFFLKLLLGMLAVTLIAWAALPYGFGLLDLAKFFAVAVGAWVLAVIGYPQVRGVRKGDGLIAVNGSISPLVLFSASTCVALEGGKKGDTIAVKLGNGSLAEGVIVGYEGLITPGRLKITERRPSKTIGEVTVI